MPVYDTCCPMQERHYKPTEKGPSSLMWIPQPNRLRLICDFWHVKGDLDNQGQDKEKIRQRVNEWKKLGLSLSMGIPWIQERFMTANHVFPYSLLRQEAYDQLPIIDPNDWLLVDQPCPESLMKAAQWGPWKKRED